MTRLITTHAGTALSTEVASLLPRLSVEARHENVADAERGYRRPSRSFCPVCSGPKSKDAARCASCRNDAIRQNNANARKDGHRGRGLSYAAPVSMVGPLVGVSHPGVQVPTDDTARSVRATGRGHVRGDGTLHRQSPPARMVKQADGSWAKA